MSSHLQLFATQMYDVLNPRWASTLLGCIAAAMIPIPFVLIKCVPPPRTRVVLDTDPHL